MAPSNMSIQTGSDQPSMKQDDHPDHNMPDSEYEAYIIAHERPGDYPVVARSGKSDKEKKDQSRQ